MADVEKVHVKLGISGTYWEKKPQYRVSFNDSIISENFITANSDEVEYLEFDVEYATESAVLKVELLNKQDSDTVQSDDKSCILRDMLLNIVEVEIDEIDLGPLLFSHSIYTTENIVSWRGENTNTIKNCLNLGWNGAWTLTWSNSFYIWLLEEL
jgi:hypothetical protein